MAGRGKRNEINAGEFKPREYRNANRPRNIENRSQDMPSTSRQDDWDEVSTDNLKLSPQEYMQHRAWLEELYSTWNKSNDFYLISSMLKISFKTSTNPYQTALFLMTESPDFKMSRPNTLSNAVIKAFKDFLNDETNYQEELTAEIQLEAFESIETLNNFTLIEIVVDVYKLGDVGEKFIDKVKKMVLLKEYKSACLFATMLRIQSHFDKDEFLIPLLLQDRVNFVQTYLDKCTEQQEEFVRFLDSMCSYERSAFHLASTLNVVNAKPAKWNAKAFRKLGTRLMKLYNISSDVCPNMAQIKNTGALKYLLYKKYVEGAIGDAAWEEMIDEIVKDDLNLQIELCASLVCYNDMPCAIKCALKYNVPRDRIPVMLQEALENNNLAVGGEEESWDVAENNIESEEFYGLNLPFEAIFLIDTKDKFNQMLDIIQLTDIIGCDSEWKPDSGSGTKLSILQLSIPDRTFIIDVKCLLENKQLLDSDWKALKMIVFVNPEIRKLGFGFTTDLKMLSQSIPEFEALQTDSKNLIDIFTLCQKIAAIEPKIFPYGCDTGRGLTDVVRMCLGKKLDKREQFSNWDKRPLRKEQILYAALDSFCLLEIYNVINMKAEELNFNLDELISSSQGKKTKRKCPKSHPVNKQRDVQSIFKSCVTKSPGEFKVVVDSMLHGLGRQLRLMGVDVRVIENPEDHQNAVSTSLKENRVILTSGQPYTKMCQYVGPEMCYNVDVKLPQREQAQAVLNFYKIEVKENDIFSRCQKCNNNRYIKIPSVDVEKLWRKSLNEDSKRRKMFWMYFDGGKIDVENLMTDENVKLQFDGFKDGLFSRVELFYVCATCGKVYWEGSHLKRIVSTLKMKNLVISD